MTMIPAFGPWPEHPADADEEKRLASAQQSKTSPISIDKEHETGVFYGSGKDPYQTSLASCTCNDFVRRKKPCKHVFRLAMELGIIDAAYKTGRSTGERNEAQLSFADCLDLVEQLSDAAQNEMMCVAIMSAMCRHRASGQRSYTLLSVPQSCSPLYAPMCHLIARASVSVKKIQSLIMLTDASPCPIK